MFHLNQINDILPGSNPFDSDKESNNKTLVPDSRIKLFEDDHTKVKPSSSHSVFSSARSRYKNDFTKSGGLENQSVQDLEKYAHYKAEETTKTLNSCLKLAEKIRDDGTKTLVVLHHQGDQITRAHSAAANIDYDLSRGEKLLGSLGGIFSNKWKPSKTRKISGPVMTRDENKRKYEHLKQKQKLGLNNVSKGKSNASTTYPQQTDVYKKVEVEEAKQDDTLAHLSNILDELKDMAHEIGVESDRFDYLFEKYGMESIISMSHIF